MQDRRFELVAPAFHLAWGHAVSPPKGRRFPQRFENRQVHGAPDPLLVRVLVVPDVVNARVSSDVVPTGVEMSSMPRQVSARMPSGEQESMTT